MNLVAALLLWFSMMVLILTNSAIGDTLIAGSGGIELGEVYNAVVPLPYIALCAWIYARHATERAMPALLVVGLLWATSTTLADIAVAHFGLGRSWRLAAVHYRFWDGYWFVLVPLAQLVAPLVAGRLVRPATATIDPGPLS